MVGERDGIVRSLTYKVKSPFEANLFETVTSLELKCQQMEITQKERKSIILTNFNTSEATFCMTKMQSDCKK